MVCIVYSDFNQGYNFTGVVFLFFSEKKEMGG